MFRSITLVTLVVTISTAAVNQAEENEEPLFTPLKLQYVAPKAFLSSAGLITGPQYIPTPNPQIVSPRQYSTPENEALFPLTLLTLPSDGQKYLNQERSGRLPPPNNHLPELQFADPRMSQRVLPILASPQASALFNAAYQPSYILMMAMPPASYSAVGNYNDQQNIQQSTKYESDSLKPTINAPKVNSKSNTVQRSNSDTVPASDSSSDFSDSVKSKVFSVSYKDNHVKYSY